jgi:hypothetical protein
MESGGPMEDVRPRLRSELRGRGHLAMLSEELWESDSDVSLRLQELIQARNFDLVVSIPATPGAIGEAHDFAAHPAVMCKMLVFVNERHVAGYSEQSLRALSTVLSCQLEYYPDVDNTEIIERITLEQVQRLREMKYMFGWRTGA